MALLCSGFEPRGWPELEGGGNEHRLSGGAPVRTALMASAAVTTPVRLPTVADPSPQPRWLKVLASTPLLGALRVRQLEPWRGHVVSMATVPENGPPRAVG